ncbi:MAG: hypothetical protein JSS70_15830 [Bacteroidetes bacterium]|nr:hypothetical protein [Bacteroidota bacterium]
MNHILFLPVDKHLFNKSLINCSGLITGGGFETPAEAIHLGKKLMSIPIRGQYEQMCNSAALKQMGITCKQTIGTGFKNEFYEWMNEGKTIRIDYSKSIPLSLNHVFSWHGSTAERFTAELGLFSES